MGFKMKGWSPMQNRTFKGGGKASNMKTAVFKQQEVVNDEEIEVPFDPRVYGEHLGKREWVDTEGELTTYATRGDIRPKYNYTTTDSEYNYNGEGMQFRTEGDYKVWKYYKDKGQEHLIPSKSKPKWRGWGAQENIDREPQKTVIDPTSTLTPIDQKLVGGANRNYERLMRDVDKQDWESNAIFGSTDAKAAYYEMTPKDKVFTTPKGEGGHSKKIVMTEKDMKRLQYINNIPKEWKNNITIMSRTFKPNQPWIEFTDQQSKQPIKNKKGEITGYTFGDRGITYSTDTGTHPIGTSKAFDEWLIRELEGSGKVKTGPHGVDPLNIESNVNLPLQPQGPDQTKINLEQKIIKKINENNQDKIKRTIPTTKQYDERSFGDAFRRARSGEGYDGVPQATFEWQGKKYHSRRADESKADWQEKFKTTKASPGKEPVKVESKVEKKPKIKVKTKVKTKGKKEKEKKKLSEFLGTSGRKM